MGFLGEVKQTLGLVSQMMRLDAFSKLEETPPPVDFRMRES